MCICVCACTCVLMCKYLCVRVRVHVCEHVHVRPLNSNIQFTKILGYLGLAAHGRALAV